MALLPFLLPGHLCTRPPDAFVTALLKAGTPLPTPAQHLAPHTVHGRGRLTEYLSSRFKDAITHALEGDS